MSLFNERSEDYSKRDKKKNMSGWGKIINIIYMCVSMNGVIESGRPLKKGENNILEHRYHT